MSTKPKKTLLDPRSAFYIVNQSGDFSGGGSHPSFWGKGKEWRTRGAVSNHLALVKSSRYDKCELVEVELVPRVVSRRPVHDVMADSVEKRNQREAKKTAKRDAVREQQRKDNLKSTLSNIFREYSPEEIKAAMDK